jgi:hypothetical protein
MKRNSVIFLLTLLAGGIFVSFSYAQESTGPTNTSEFYVLQVPIQKIYSHAKGYIIEYRKNGMGMERLYLPLEWFTRKAVTEGPLKGEIVKLRQGNIMPYLAIYYKAGATDHVRLYVRDYRDNSWGNIPVGVNLDDNFNGVENLTVAY